MSERFLWHGAKDVEIFSCGKDEDHERESGFSLFPLPQNSEERVNDGEDDNDKQTAIFASKEGNNGDFSFLEMKKKMIKIVDF